MPDLPRRLDAGPLLLAVGAVLLLVSLFLEWFEPGLTAWNAFEWLDLLLAGLALAVLAGAVALAVPGSSSFDPEPLPLLAAAALAVVAVQLLDPPPAARGATPGTGAWLALAGCLVMGIGTVLAFGRMRLQVSFEGRSRRRPVQTVDARSRARAARPGSRAASGDAREGAGPASEPPPGAG